MKANVMQEDLGVQTPQRSSLRDKDSEVRATKEKSFQDTKKAYEHLRNNLQTDGE